MNLSVTDRLTLANGPAVYQYQNDPADNLTNQAGAQGTVNALNQLTSWDYRMMTHDAAGNLTDDGTRTYAWDAEQRLVRIGYTGTSRSTEFRYDAFGRRTAVIESDGTTATEARHLWCGERIC